MRFYSLLNGNNNIRINDYSLGKIRNQDKLIYDYFISF